MCSIVTRFIVWGGVDSGGITKKGLSNTNDQPCEICGLRVRVDLVLCVQYCSSVHSMDSGGIIKKGLSNSNDQPCEICEGVGGDGQWRHYKERLV